MPTSLLSSFSELPTFDTMKPTIETYDSMDDAELLAFLDADFAYAPDISTNTNICCESPSTIDDPPNVPGSTPGAPSPRQPATPGTTELTASSYTTISPSSSVCGTDVEFKSFDAVNPSDEANFGEHQNVGTNHASGTPRNPSKKRRATSIACSSSFDEVQGLNNSETGQAPSSQQSSPDEGDIEESRR